MKGLNEGYFVAQYISPLAKTSENLLQISQEAY